MNVALMLISVAFWSWPLLLLIVWCCASKWSRPVLWSWWVLVLLSQFGWVFMIL